MAVSGQRHAPAALLPTGKGPPVPIEQEAGWAPEPVWTQRIEEKSFAPPGSNPDRPVVQPVVRHYTAWANPAPKIIAVGKNVKQSHNTPMEAQGDEMMCSSYSFTTSALDGVSVQRHAPAALYSRGKDLITHWTGGWVGPRAGLDTEARGDIPLPLPGIEPRSPGRPVRI
jgi:hypothetical protein